MNIKTKQLAFDIPKGRPAVFRQRQLSDKSPFPFGKHKGTPMELVPISYLNWFKQQDWSNKWPAVLAYIERTNKPAEAFENNSASFACGGSA